ncbi:hypothetical protein DOE76_09820 [Leifsonia sp. ku-ls]|nr:hypothetical protein DOE76_09820 [Leifsonia sp. ku-ls]
MSDPNWTDVVSAISAATVPIAVVVLGVVIGRRQTRNIELVKARLDYYRLLAPDLNRLMCYITFIGTWRDESPPSIIALKRQLDSKFFVAAPLFSREVDEAYRALLDLSFTTFGAWGQDARIKTSAYRRRPAWQGEDAWQADWDNLFSIGDSESISRESLASYRDTYDKLLAALVKDIDVSRARPKYTTDRVSLNASAPQRSDIPGEGGG